MHLQIIDHKVKPYNPFLSISRHHHTVILHLSTFMLLYREGQVVTTSGYYETLIIHCYNNTLLNVTIFFLSFFVSSNVSSHYAVSSFVGLIHASSIVSPYVLSFVLYIISSLFYYRFIHRFDYLCVWTCSIYLVCGPMLCTAVRGLHFLILLLCIDVDSLSVSHKLDRKSVV